MKDYPLQELEQEKGCRELTANVYELPVDVFTEGVSASEMLSQVLSEHAHVMIPKLMFPLLLDRPIVMSSCHRLTVHADTVVHLLPGCGGCMIRNEQPEDGRYCSYPADKNDHDICIEGGIWEYGASGISPQDDNAVMQAYGESQLALLDRNGNETNVAGREGGRGILLGALFFSNVTHLTIRNLVIRQCNFYAILIAGCDHFVVEDITFDHNKMDGVHVNGPSGYGVIQRLKGKTGDDFVALNAWDWGLSAVSFGAIHHIVVQDLESEGDELRLLPGQKTFRGGATLDCPIHDCLFRRIHNIYCVKLYQQPNCINDLMGILDKSDIPGTIQHVVFQDVELTALTATGLGEVAVMALFEICSDCDDILFENIRIGVSLKEFTAAGMHVVEVGTKSSTWKRHYDDPSHWAELFDTELICTATNLTFRNITFAGVPCRDAAVLAGAHRLTPNPDYPRTTPKGGHGYGILGTVTIE